MSGDPTRPQSQAEDESPGVRPEIVSILATEHWSLLGTRSMTWNEVMSRITIYLTVVSAFLVVLALMASATGFGPPFRVMSIGFAATALILGTLTAMRVAAASQEDAQLVRAMNRLRRAYVDFAPAVKPYLTASTHDDDDGLFMTYALGAQAPHRVTDPCEHADLRHRCEHPGGRNAHRAHCLGGGNPNPGNHRHQRGRGRRLPRSATRDRLATALRGPPGHGRTVPVARPRRLGKNWLAT